MASGFLVDSNEGSQSRRSYVSALLSQGWQQVPLRPFYPGADIAWLSGHNPPKRFAAQLKQPLDMVLSWQHGSLQDDLYQLCRTVEIPCLILDGLPWYDHKTGGLATKYGLVYSDPKTKRHPMPFSVYTRIMAELTGFRPDGISFPIIMLPGEQRALVEWLTTTGPALFDSDDVAGWSRGEAPPHHQDPRISALLGFPGLGEQRIRDLLERYGTVRKVLRAAIQGQWVDAKTKKGVVRGVGAETQRKVLEVLESRG